MEELSQECLSSKEKEKRKKLTNEMDRLEADFSEAHDKAQEYLENHKDELSSWQLTRQKILAGVESKKELYRKVWKRKFWRSKLSENKISLVKKKI